MDFPLRELPRTQIIERAHQRHADIQLLVATGWTISAIARRLNLDRKTVRRFRDTALDQFLASAKERRPGRSAGAIQALHQHPIHREPRPGQRQLSLPRNSRARLPVKPAGRTQTPRRPPRGQRRACTSGHPQSPEDHRLDHESP
ncbi:helix-turn-helix domain-containing protein [Streptomyces mirabilis]|uniref:helix-turn-helix domain-containing protein n=1 Tax=Streptomyces mirabilis TaxID=68239 RepID=UPI003333DF8A